MGKEDQKSPAYCMWVDTVCEIKAERDALAKQVERLRRVEKAVDKAIGACIFRDDPDRDELACDECPWREVCFVLAKEASHA